ncbi:MAG TPA: preprotein translocase subunit SecA [Acidimicrobiia bacterium]|nr:preprotein translocase subunit SecA [Acidimicrobiia bacterium]
MSLFSKMLRAGEGRPLKELQLVAAAINEVEPRFEALTDDQLRQNTVGYKTRVTNGEPLDDLLVDAFATVREAAKRVVGQRHYDVQLIGGGALHRGMVAEMKTGEGKTLASTLPVYLNALAGKGVHVVTVNDYLAARDAKWMGEIHRFLGLTIGLVQTGMTPEERRPSYLADVTYGTNNEFGFDYLRDNMAMRVADMVQRGHNYAIVDEVDSILIDEARTPLIISGRVADNAKWYKEFARISQRMRRDEHYEVDEGKRQVLVTEEGVARVEEILGIENLYDHAAVDLVHHMESALRAKELYHRDVEYLLDNGEVKIVDEFTGRVLEGRRYSEGLHQAIEAKENVAIKDENQTLATITLQNYFRLYDKLAGMTGTAETEAAELAQIYNVQVLVIPPNRPVVRIDADDLVYKSEDAKFNSVIDEVSERHANGQPVLLGTVSIEKSERLSAAFTKRGITHEVLNAKAHAREADIIAQAGRVGAVTVATNMAGRGVDIMLGGNPEGSAIIDLKRAGIAPTDPSYEEKLEELAAKYETELQPLKNQVIDAGGLYVVGTERHESRRIDNQLRGRSGRQGDPGESRFFLSLEDDLMRRFRGEQVASIMERLNIPDDQPIEAGMVNKAVERAQRQVESQNFEIRKNVLKYDEVMNRQREVIYGWRSGILHGELTDELVNDWTEKVLEDIVVGVFGGAAAPSDWDWEELAKELAIIHEDFDIGPHRFEGSMSVDKVVELVLDDAREIYAGREKELGPEVLRQVERSVMLQLIDNKWREHLAEMDYLRAGIGLRAMGQRDPLSEYQREGFEMFTEVVESVKRDAVRYLFRVQLVQPKQQPQRPQPQAQQARGPMKPVTIGDKIGRNEPCPCGSGKKYKRCHGANSDVPS